MLIDPIDVVPVDEMFESAGINRWQLAPSIMSERHCRPPTCD